MLPLLLAEPLSSEIRDLFAVDPDLIVWWATGVECVSAISRLERDDELTHGSAERALERLDALESAWAEVQPVETVRRAARRILRVHPLRAADALQLGAATAAAEERPETLEIVSLDRRLSDAARREGFPVTNVRE